MKTEISTDQKGRFYFYFPMGMIGERLNRLDLELLDEDEQATGLLARIRQFEELGSRPWNLGTVSLELAPLILKGRVLLDGKAPRQVQLTSRQLTIWSEGRDGHERQVPGVSLKDLAGGEFSIRGFPPQSALLLKLNWR